MYTGHMKSDTKPLSFQRWTFIEAKYTFTSI